MGATQIKAQVMTEKVIKSKLSDPLIYPAVVNSAMNAIINADAEGVVKSILVSPGKAVKRGQTLMIIENQDPIYRYSSVRVVAPANGVVSSVEVSVLSKVEKAQPLVSLTDPNRLKIEIDVPASDLGLIKMGAKGIYRETPKSTQTFPAKLTGLAPLIDKKTGTAKGEIEVSKTAHLIPGQIGQVQFEANERNRIVIPESAVIFRDGKTWVRQILAGKKAQKIPVQLGVRLGETFEVLSGLDDQTQIVVRANRFIADGEEVEVSETPKKSLNR